MNSARQREEALKAKRAGFSDVRARSFGAYYNEESETEVLFVFALDLLCGSCIINEKAGGILPLAFGSNLRET